MGKLCFLVSFFLCASAIIITENDVVKLKPVKKSKSKQTTEDVDVGGLYFMQIPKTMSTMSKIVFCNLKRAQLGIEGKDIMPGEKNTCITNFWYRGVRRAPRWHAPQHKPRLIILRDPVNRFVSMYTYLCQSKGFCKHMDIHQFAGKVYHSLRTGTLRKGFSPRDRAETFRHIQPSSWYVYARKDTLADNPVVVYITLNRRDNARKLQRVLVEFANVPAAVAQKAVLPIRATYGNTLKTPRGKRDHANAAALENAVYERRATLLSVLKAYYNDYRLLKMSLPERLRRAIRAFDISLPDKITKVRGGHILQDHCPGERYAPLNGRTLPVKPC